MNLDSISNPLRDYKWGNIQLLTLQSQQFSEKSLLDIICPVMNYGFTDCHHDYLPALISNNNCLLSSLSQVTNGRSWSRESLGHIESTLKAAEVISSPSSSIRQWAYQKTTIYMAFNLHTNSLLRSKPSHFATNFTQVMSVWMDANR